MEYPARTSLRTTRGSEPDNAAERGQEAHAGRAASLLQARIACVSHRTQLIQRIDRRMVECLVFRIGRGFFVREPDFTNRDPFSKKRTQSRIKKPNKMQR